MNLTGRMLIGQQRIAGSQTPIQAIDPAINQPLEPAYPGGTAAQVEQACALAWAAFDSFRETSLEARATFLETIASESEALGDALIDRAVSESGLPREVLHLVSLSKQAAKGDAKARRLARELEAALAVLSSFDEGCDLVLYYKHLMVLNGDLEYSLHFNPSDALSDAQRNYAQAQYTLFRQWYANWSAENNVA